MSSQKQPPPNYKKKSFRHHRPDICDNNMKFEDCELAILRKAVDDVTEKTAEKIAMGPDIKKIIEIVEDFLRKKKVICYGGTAINNILPEESQFYDRKIDIPDYDFYSINALNDAKELADIYYKEGYKDVEAKSGVHFGTYKVFVNFIPVADITFMENTIFQNLIKKSIIIDGIHYAAPNWLRMGMYLELCRPLGDISRWEKVLKRLTLLNRHYPLKSGEICNNNEGFQRKAENFDEETSDKIYNIIHDTFIEQNVVFFGAFAMSLYGEYMTNFQRGYVKSIADFDVLTENPKRVAELVISNLKDAGFKKARYIEHPPAGEILPRHYEISIGKEIFAFIYEPNECVNYNKIKLQNKTIKVGTIDTILRFYLAFLYTGRNYYDFDRLICMSHFLFIVQQKNRLEQRGILRRFTMDCIGKQKTLEDIRAEKAEQFRKLRRNKNDPEYEKWFLKYSPAADKFDDDDKEDDKEEISVLSSLQKTRKQRKKKRTTKKRFVYEFF